MADPRAPTRADLAKFLPDQRTIRAFEKLFEIVPDEYNILIEQALIEAGSATSKAQIANDSLARIADGIEQLLLAAPVKNDTFLKGDYIDLPVNGPHVTLPRRIQWNEDDGTVDVGLYGGSVYQLGQELGYYAKNTSGSTITNGTPVMFTGTVGASGKLTFGPAVSDGTYPPEYMMGVATQDIANNAFGYVTHFGLVRGFDTSGTPYGETWSDGDLLCFDAATPGTWTNVQPSAPAWKKPIGVVVNAGSGGSGSIFVRIEINDGLKDLHDVQITSAVDDDLLQYNSTNSRWENIHPSAIEGIPQTKTADFTVGASGRWFINNKSGSTCTVTLPSAATYPGRKLSFQNYQAQQLISASSNVVPQGGGSAGTAILTDVAGNWATLVSDGSDWLIMQAAPFNILLY